MVVELQTEEGNRRKIRFVARCFFLVSFSIYTIPGREYFSSYTSAGTAVIQGNTLYPRPNSQLYFLTTNSSLENFPTCFFLFLLFFSFERSKVAEDELNETAGRLEIRQVFSSHRPREWKHFVEIIQTFN